MRRDSDFHSGFFDHLDDCSGLARRKSPTDFKSVATPSSMTFEINQLTSNLRAVTPTLRDDQGTSGIANNRPITRPKNASI